MSTGGDKHWAQYCAHGFGPSEPSDGKKGLVRLDWMLALGRNSLGQGDLGMALKYFNMALDMDNTNDMAKFYRNLTRRLIMQREE